MSTGRDYYEVLGVAQDADEETIRKAYRTLVRRHHPDVAADPDADEAFTEITEAYRVLSKPTTRLLYDHFGYRGPGNGWFGPVPSTSEDAPSLLSKLADVLPGRRSETVVAEVELDAVEAERGAKRIIEFAETEVCGTCGGDGAAPGTGEPCPVCGGRGNLRRVSSVPEAKLVEIEPCPECGGAGQLAAEPCPDCGGDGAFTLPRRVEVRIPRGVDDGTRLQLAAQNGKPTQVLIRVRKLEESAAARYAAAVGLLLAVVLLIALLLGA